MMMSEPMVVVLPVCLSNGSGSHTLGSWILHKELPVLSTSRIQALVQLVGKIILSRDTQYVIRNTLPILKKQYASNTLVAQG
jgi:hypothetical protein